MTIDYAHALTVAVEAARSAAVLLRQEFHRLSGLPSDPDHADVDLAAEQTIRARLLAAFPDWGYLGEETGARPAPVHCQPAHVWLVDPNDGTRAYLQGYRGTAVSIALLRDGVPVLGVVYAYAAPDDEGDLFTWAEGHGPLRRNGAPIDRPAWPTKLNRHDVILVAYNADRAVDGNLACVTPARFRSVPSIAYRLALVAAGEAVATSSLNAPRSWDLAGGHALLRAVGGDIVDENGEPMHYGLDGVGGVRRAFGGAPALLASLTRRPWADAASRRNPPIDPPTPFPLDLVHPIVGATVANAGVLRRAQGCLLGQVAGDSLGSLVEFQSPESIARRFPGGIRRLKDGGCWDTIAGQPTDDSELALMLARSIVGHGRPDQEATAQAFGWWLRSRPFDVGRTTWRALSSVEPLVGNGQPVAEVAQRAASAESQANGSLMRISPIGVWGALSSGDPVVVADAARANSRLTHPHPACQEACATFAVAIARAIATGDSPTTVYEWTLQWTRRHGTQEDVRRALVAAASSPPASFSISAGWVLVAFQNAFYRLLHSPSLEEGIVETAMAGGDADTNCAIAGALLGACHGRSAVPDQWRRLVLSCRPANGLPGVVHPRPRPVWPVDLPFLAERLLVHGQIPGALTIGGSSPG